MCPEIIWVITERILYSSTSALMCGRDCWWLFGRSTCFATSVYMHPLPRFSLTWSAETTGRWYHWQSEHECGTCRLALRHILAVLCEVFSGLGRGGPTAWPPRSIPHLNPMGFHLWEHLTTLVYAAPIDNEKALHVEDIGALTINVLF
jgi:hypothetical protein